jgi:hypothetical protein
MTINISTPKQQEPSPVVRSQFIIGDPISTTLNTAQAIYKFANRVVYSDIREKGLTGYYYGNAPWYYDSANTETHWVSQIAKLPYRASSPLPGSDINTSAAPPGGWINPVGVGDPSLTFYIEGCNLEYAIQVERVTFNPTTGVVTYGAVPLSRYSNVLPGAYNLGSPWLSTYDVDQVKIGLPDGTTDTSLLLIDFMCRGASTALGGNSLFPAFLGAFAIWDTPFSDFPAGSY